jgi:hypothetical protein
VSPPKPATAPKAPAAEDWIPGQDDLLPATPRPTAKASLGRRGGGAPFGRRRNRSEEADGSAPDGVVAGSATAAHAALGPAPSTPDDRESYAFWSKDPAPRDFSDVMALPDQPLDGSAG